VSRTLTSRHESEIAEQLAAINETLALIHTTLGMFYGSLLYEVEERLQREKNADQADQGANSDA